MRFNEKANMYDGNAIAQRDAALWGAQWIEDSLDGRIIKEFGAGTGLFSEELIKRAPERFYASDVSEKMVIEGTKKLPNIAWSTENAWEPNTGKYDRIYSSSLLQWARDPVMALRKWTNGLNEGGKMLHIFFVKGSLCELNDVMPRLKGLEWRDCAYWLNAFVQAGITLTRYSEKVNKYYYPDVFTILKQLRDSGVTPEKSVGRQQTILRQAIINYDKRYRSAAGVPCTWSVMRIECCI
ncbi:MAG: hypothetical protein COZ46_07675 [Verrucomicrobia bacterium CG_4_10_14_3_um_filter_43_23]|nr:MAG: hypothetical protein AUJ82_03320 [Verrucomicrobia bacterium CG1_02_43_26]PIP59726.1 MAG: hypothetical protein COX01_02150 [Verrucomicrobia bacterium CG22_combo_CG10-13_8_21_14_all_43_17]PIX57738.1 MAG: hypothetical protein COZ46_07675 [Verrucomicrobia bacterium CG_4_10_14_3_um_filter_43_23]PJA44650.1 MAG: hypothetical protein CO175_01765 [Verrucomicrobia bacterium CG_4_9_14_3_um_filter_43_20]